MKTIRRINIENKQGYFFNGTKNTNDFDPSLLNIDDISFKSDELIMYDIKHIKNLNSLSTLYLVFNNLDGCFKSGADKYLIFSSTEKNKTMLENYTELFDDIKEQIKLITGDKMFNNGKDFMKIKFKTNDDLPYNKDMNIPVCVIIISSIFKEEDEYYRQVLLHDCFYEYDNPSDM